MPPQSGQRVPGGSSSPIGRVNQALEPSLTNRSATRSMAAGTRWAFSGSAQVVQRKAGMGTPQTRWRDRHQSGRTSIMPRMRSRPQAGIQVVRSISDRAPARRLPLSLASPSRANHWVVARNRTGLLQRQHSGYWWRIDSPGRLSRKPLSASSATTLGLASNTVCPAQWGTSGV